MKAKIHYTLPNGCEDSIVLTGDSVEEIRAKADEALSARHATDPWSEIIED